MALEIMNYKAAEKLVNNAIAHTAKGDELVHQAAVQCLAHAAPQGVGGHGDCTLLDKLIKGLGKSIRVKGLRQWVFKFSPVRWNGDDKVGMLKPGAKGYVPFDLEAADANPFWTLSEAEESTNRKPLDMVALMRLIEGMSKRIEKAANEDNFDGDIESAKAFAKAVTETATKFVKKHPEAMRDGLFDPTDPENAKAGVPAPKPAPRKVRKSVAPTEQVAA